MAGETEGEMEGPRLSRRLLLAGAAAAAVGRGAAAAPPVGFRMREAAFDILVGAERIAAFVHRDERIARPYLAHVSLPGGPQVTRAHPPVAGTDPTDHDTMHPGIWLAFGDLGGADFWRNRAAVRTEGLTLGPHDAEGGAFTVRNAYRAPGGALVCGETARQRVAVHPDGVLLAFDSVFSPGEGPCVFGDQEEMGLGVRLATPLAPRNGGVLMNSAGLRGESGAWGKAADWCDTTGVVAGRKAGVTLMAHPDNFRRSWFHVRDYGLMVANPFGRNAFTGGERSAVTVAAGEKLRLRFGVFLHRGADPREAWRRYLSLAR